MGDRGTAAVSQLRGAAMKEISSSPVHSSAGTPGGSPMSTPPATSAGVNASGGIAIPGASVEPSPSVSEEDEVDDSISPELGRRAARELRWHGETPVVRQRRTREEQKQLDLDSAGLFVEKHLLLRSPRNGCGRPSCVTVLPESIACTTRCCLAP